MKSSYSFEDPWYRRTDRIDFGMYSQISGDEENNKPPTLH